MIEVWKIKKTNEIVYPLGDADTTGYTLCLFPFKHVSRKGYRGDIRPVKNENLVKNKEFS